MARQVGRTARALGKDSHPYRNRGRQCWGTAARYPPCRCSRSWARLLQASVGALGDLSHANGGAVLGRLGLDDAVSGERTVQWRSQR